MHFGSLAACSRPFRSDTRPTSSRDVCPHLVDELRRPWAFFSRFSLVFLDLFRVLEPAKQAWYRWRYCSESSPNDSMCAYLQTPLPGRRRDVQSLEFVALDLETTGLSPSTDRIVSVGSVCVFGTRVRCSTARHAYVRIDGSVEQSATIHQIRDMDLHDARPERDVLDGVLQVLAGRVLLVHHAPVDLGFLRAACRRHYGISLITRTVDTLQLARRLREHGEQRVGEGELRLHALREAYGLPRYSAHNALSDAVATAELYLALLHRWAGRDTLPLRTILA